MPVYNERDAIGGVLRKWSSALDALNVDYVIRPYNDGSKDDSLSVMRDVAKGFPRVEVRDKPNGGHGPTILQGYREAAADGFDWVFQIDSDDEMGPEKFGELWARRNDYDFLVGIRDGRKQALPRKVISLVSRICVRLLYGRSVWDVNTPYRLMRVSAFAAFFGDIPHDTFAPNVILSGLSAKHNLRCFEIPVPQRDRQTGEVSIKKWRLLRAATRSFSQTIGFSIKRKLQFSDVCLLAIASASLVIGLYFLLSLHRIVTLLWILLGVIVLHRIPPFRSICALLWQWIAKHVIASFSVIIIAGVLERVVFDITMPEAMPLYSDFKELWDCAGKVVNGEIDLSKSWTTVLLWAGVRRFIGDGVLVRNIIAIGVQIVTCVFGFCFLSKWISRRSALLFVAFFFWSLFVVIHTPSVTATEHLFVVFITLTLLISNLLYSVKTPGFAFLSACFCGLVMWMTTWTRCEGLLLWLVVPVWHWLFNKSMRKLRLAIPMLMGFMLVLVLGAATAIYVNRVLNDEATIFCSADNLWPRLFGSNLSSTGRVTHEDFMLIWNRYLKENPDSKLSRTFCDQKAHYHRPFPLVLHWKCPKEIRPYVREETRTRWLAMDMKTFLCHVFKKERLVWCEDYLHWLYGVHLFQNSSPRLLFYCFQGASYILPSCIALAWFLCSLIVLLRVLTGRVNVASPVLMPVVFILIDVGALAIAESAQRYGYTYHLIGPMVVALLADLLSKESTKCPLSGSLRSA